MIRNEFFRRLCDVCQNALHRRDLRARQTSRRVRRLGCLRRRNTASACPAATIKHPRRALRLWRAMGLASPLPGNQPDVRTARPCWPSGHLRMAGALGELRAIRFMAKASIICMAVAGAATPHSTFLMSGLLGARSTRLSSKRSASYSAGKVGGCRAGHGDDCATTSSSLQIIAPYNAQVFELQDRIPGSRVGTVDKFQGQEARRSRRC